MPVPNNMADLSTLASSNFPTGTESIGNNLDNYIRSISAILRSIYGIASATIASASTVDLGSADNEFVTVTGTSTINSFGTGYSGCKRQVKFSSALTIVNSSSIQLPYGANISVAANDILDFRCVSPGVWALCSGSRDVGALRTTGGTVSGDLRVNAQLRIQAAPGNNIIRAINNGAGATIIQSVTPDESDFSYMELRASYMVLQTPGMTIAGSTTVNGDLTASGNVTGGSDERVKKNWQDIPHDLIEKLAAMARVGTYERTDIGTIQTGVGAQSLQKVLPYTVHEGDDGFLSVAYGNAALVGTVAAARRILALEARVKALETA